MARTPSLRPVRPSAALTERYQRRLDREIDAMAKSVAWWLRVAYRANRPVSFVLYGQDASPANVLAAATARLRKRWLARFDRLADDLASYFAADARERVDRNLREDLRRGAFTVKFKMTTAMRDAADAVRLENVALIKSIADQHMTAVDTLVQRSVAAGRDLGVLAQGLERQAGVTKRRAAFIARDQNNRATAMMARVRYLETGITKAKWLHSAGGRTPRPEHVAFNGHTFDLAAGHNFDNGEGIVWPGTAINCRCVMMPVVPGFE